MGYMRYWDQGSLLEESPREYCLQVQDDKEVIRVVQAMSRLLSQAHAFNKNNLFLKP